MFVSIVLTAMDTRAGNGDSGLTLTYREEGMSVTLSLSNSLSSVARAGEPAAILLTLTVAKGYALEEVAALGEISDWVVTYHGEEATVEKTAMLLLDGYVCRDVPDGEALLSLRFAPTDVDSRRDERPFIRLQSSCLYYVKDGEVYTCPITVETVEAAVTTPEDIPPPGTDTADTAKEEALPETRLDTEGWESSPSMTEETAETAETAKIAETTEISETELMTEAAPSDQDFGRFFYVGCQETRPERGVYAVRFLFCGEAADGASAVICMRGGGQLSLSVCRKPVVEAYAHGRLSIHAPPAGGEWHVITFGGLKAERDYEFFVYTEGRLLRVTYENGCFGEIQEKIGTIHKMNNVFIDNITKQNAKKSNLKILLDN